MGALVIASIFDATGREAPELGPEWHLQIQGSDQIVIIGHPLESTLAELLGYKPAHDEWPDWVTELASRIEADAAR
jgi:hypothetical protein